MTSVEAGARNNGLMAQLIRFVLVGGLSAVVDYGTYQLFYNIGIWADVAKGMSFILGTTTAYLLNRRWTFNNATGGRASAAKFVALYTVTFFVNVGVNALMLRLLGDFPGHLSVAWVIAQAVATAINFVMLRTVVFRASA
ncbi:GtrA family protein [Kibdelosporangium lantanae]|uniref:GtrA family protein n=1 Tax=Kibdelosporangium lantanae TaxID=1497396 RepID=A0ABW3M3X4_9PSEU